MRAHCLTSRKEERKRAWRAPAPSPPAVCIGGGLFAPHAADPLSTPQVMLSSLLEAAFLGSTLLVPGAAFSLLSLLLGRTADLRQSFGQRVLGAYSVREVRRSVTVSQYQPPSAGCTPARAAAGEASAAEAVCSPGFSGFKATPLWTDSGSDKREFSWGAMYSSGNKRNRYGLLSAEQRPQREVNPGTPASLW
jgi:hypothetical protein